MISSRFFEDEPDKICSDLSEKGPKGRFLRPISSKITLAKEKEKKKEGAKGKKGGEEKKKTRVTLLVFIMATLAVTA